MRKKKRVHLFSCRALTETDELFCRALTKTDENKREYCNRNEDRDRGCDSERERR